MQINKYKLCIEIASFFRAKLTQTQQLIDFGPMQNMTESQKKAIEHSKILIFFKSRLISVNLKIMPIFSRVKVWSKFYSLNSTHLKLN